MIEPSDGRHQSATNSNECHTNIIIALPKLEPVVCLCANLLFCHPYRVTHQSLPPTQTPSVDRHRRGTDNFLHAWRYEMLPSDDYNAPRVDRRVYLLQARIVLPRRICLPIDKRTALWRAREHLLDRHGTLAGVSPSSRSSSTASPVTETCTHIIIVTLRVETR